MLQEAAMLESLDVVLLNLAAQVLEYEVSKGRIAPDDIARIPAETSLSLLPCCLRRSFLMDMMSCCRPLCT